MNYQSFVKKQGTKMPKSKVRKTARKPQARIRPSQVRPVCNIQNTAPVIVSPSRTLTNPRVRRVQAAQYLDGNDVEEREFSPGGTTWIFPRGEQVAIVDPDPYEAKHWEESPIAAAIGAGMDDGFLDSLSEVAIETLRESSQPVGNERFAYTEIFSEGFFDYEEIEKSKLRVWLDECYLGTWDDPSFAVGPFLRDISGTRTISAEKRTAAYERLKRFCLIVEHRFTTGRTLVAIAVPISDVDRFLANQWMLYGLLPEVMSLG
jgi:hypothetical protein